VTVQRCAVELGKDVDAAQFRVDAVGDGDIDEAILATEWHGRLRAVFGEGEKTTACSATHNDAQSVLEGVMDFLFEIAVAH